MNKFSEATNALNGSYLGIPKRDGTHKEPRKYFSQLAADIISSDAYHVWIAPFPVHIKLFQTYDTCPLWNISFKQLHKTPARTQLFPRPSKRFGYYRVCMLAN